MTTAQHILTAMSSGMNVISGASAVMLHQFRDDPFARELIRLHEVYFGSTKYTRKQARAQQTNQSLAGIRALEAKLRGLKESDQWAIREELLGLDLTVDQLTTEAKKRADALKTKPVKEHGVTIRRSKDGPFQITITGDSADITDMKHALGDTIEPAKKFFFGNQNNAEKPD